MVRSSEMLLGGFLLLLIISHLAFAARTMQNSNMVDVPKKNPSGGGTALTDNKNLVFGGVGSGIGGGAGFVGPFGAVGGFSGIGGGVGAVGLPVGGGVGGIVP